MPLYEYKCRDCGAQFEELVSASDASVRCPKCGSEQTERQLSVFAAGNTGTSGGSIGCGSGFS
ncbi:MAG: zinc ribbon domain-containing protein [Candidatus Zixiibacteriota bacterium]|nr:MAG: zinc ribbon domain-containing protein [candidate division Zixibacteria bacterium]